MIKLQYVPPDIPAEDAKRAQKLVADMNTIVNSLTKWGRNASNSYALLTPANRTELLQAGLARNIVANTAFFTEQISSSQSGSATTRNQLMVGFTFAAFDPDLFASPAIRKALLQSHHGRCCYCETLFDQADAGRVEHFRPKSGYTDGSTTVYRPGYYALAYQPNNLLYSCAYCQAFKGDFFPVTGLRYPQVPVEQETPILINPYVEDPRQFIRFNPLNAEAYAYDLVQLFYTQSKGLGPDDTQKLLWSHPDNIPLQSSIFGAPLSDQQINADFTAWVAANKTATPSRGQQTIAALNLNRPELLRARASQLLKLRGVRSMSINTTDPDCGAALSLKADLENLQSPTSSLQSPEYLSASIDALNTWDAGGGQQLKFQFVQVYCDILKAVPSPQRNPPVAAPLPATDAVIYLVFNRGRKLAGKRRVVYISAADKVYANQYGKHGVMLPIDWQAEINNEVLITTPRGTTRTSTLRALLSEPPLQLAQVFTQCEVWALGQYLPLDN